MRARVRTLWLAPVAAVVLFYVARILTPVDSELTANRIFNVAAFLVAAYGCLRTAASFQTGDYLRVAWQMQGTASLLLAASSVVRHLDPPDLILLVRAALTFMSNVTSTIAAVIFARTASVAGLQLPWSRTARWVLASAMALVAVGLVGPTLVIVGPLAINGDLGSWISMISSVGDLAFLMLIAPIFMTALALRGGLLIWPWTFLTVSVSCWLLYDAQEIVAYLLPDLGPAEMTLWTTPLRILACGYLYAAAVAQRWLTSGAIDRSGT